MNKLILIIMLLAFMPFGYAKLRPIQIKNSDRIVYITDSSGYKQSIFIDKLIWFISKFKRRYFYQRYDAEWALIDKNPTFLLSLFLSLGKTAEIRNKICGEYDSNESASNAVSHIIWSAILLYELPEDFSRGYLVAHESINHDELPNILMDGSLLDLYHNAFGIKIVKDYKKLQEKNNYYYRGKAGDDFFLFEKFLIKEIKKLIALNVIIVNRRGRSDCHRDEQRLLKDSKEFIIDSIHSNM